MAERYTESKTAKERWQDFKNSAKRKYYDAKDWVHENKYFCEAAALMIIGGGLSVANTAMKKTAAETEKEMREKQVYDPTNGFYYDLKRPLTTAEKGEFNARRADGEDRYDILDDMGVLKKR